MSSLYALVPIKHPVRGKSRLASVLDEQQRGALNTLLARRALEACTRVFGAQRTLVVTGSPEAAAIAGEFGISVVPEEPAQRDVNAAVGAAAEFARRAGATAIIVVPTDLPLLADSDLAAAVAAIPTAPGCLLVPDLRGTGTNVIALTPVRSDLFSFGEPSLERHARQARLLGYQVRIHRSYALELDLDRPEDYDQLRKTKAWQIFESTIQKPSAARLDSIPISRG